MRHLSNATNWRLLDKRQIKEAPSTEGLMRILQGCNLIVVSVKEGFLDVWLGDCTGRASDPPDFHFGQTNRPVYVPIPGGVTDITYKTGGTEPYTLATILIGGA